MSFFVHYFLQINDLYRMGFGPNAITLPGINAWSWSGRMDVEWFSRPSLFRSLLTYFSSTHIWLSSYNIVLLWMSLFVWGWVCVCVWVCKRKRERVCVVSEREGVRVCLFTLIVEAKCVCVCVCFKCLCVRASYWLSLSFALSVFTCVFDRESVCVCLCSC